MRFKILTAESQNPKTAKSAEKGYITAILHLAPFDLSGWQVCQHATAGCASACLNTAGRGGILKKGAVTNSIQEARKRRTRLFFEDREAFAQALFDDIKKLVNKAGELGLKPCVRLNGTSDLPWEKMALPGAFMSRSPMWRFPVVQFYDYTKVPLAKRGVNGRLPHNYSLTYSISEHPAAAARAAEYLLAGQGVAAVFRNEAPETYLERPVVPGDTDDLVFLRAGVVSALKAKGKAKQDTTGFVLD